MIKGWDEGVATMKVGGKRKVLHPRQARLRRSRFRGDDIPPNATLFFEVELLKVSR